MRCVFGQATSLMNLGIFHDNLGEFTIAEGGLMEAYKIKSRLLGPNHPSTVFIQSQLLTHYTWIGAYGKAEKAGKHELPQQFEGFEMGSRKTDKSPELVLKKQHQYLAALESKFPQLSERGRDVWFEKACMDCKGHFRCLVMSLWKVDDRVTRELIVSFFRQWTDGKSKREAFLASQKELKTRYVNPYFCGAFVMEGE